MRNTLKNFLVVLTVLCVATTTAGAAQIKVLLLGSSKPFDPAIQAVPLGTKGTIRQVTSLLRRDLKVSGSISVVYEDVYRTKTIDTAIGQGGKSFNMTYQCHSLAQWYYWPEGRDERLESLRGKGQQEYDYVVMVGDPYLIEKMPGVLAEGVTLIADCMRTGSAKPVLLLPWTDAKKAEVVCRVGNGADVPVIPARTAQKMRGACQGGYESSNPFAMKYVSKRDITYNHTGTSSERGIERGIKAATRRCGVGARKVSPESGGPKIDFNYGRANTMFEAKKRYKVDPDLFDRSYGFPMQDQSKSASTTMLYGIDMRRPGGRGYDDGTDLGIAWDMIRQNEVDKDIRCLPIRLMWAKMHEADSDMNPLGDKWHMNGHLDHASGAFIYTLLSGRCPVGPEPEKGDKKAWRNWLGQRIGYETAWRMSHLTSRVPGFTVRPQGASTLAPGRSATLAVSLFYRPESAVTVSVTSDKRDAASVQTATLTFTPDNHATPQEVTITGVEVDAETELKINLVTKSQDEVFDGLKDAWSYKAKTE